MKIELEIKKRIRQKDDYQSVQNVHNLVGTELEIEKQESLFARDTFSPVIEWDRKEVVHQNS